MGIGSRGCGPDAGRGRDAYARIGEWGSFYSRKGRKGREAPTGAPTESGQVRGRDALTRGLVIRKKWLYSVLTKTYKRRKMGYENA